MKLRKDMNFNGVKVINFPYTVEDGEEMYSLFESVVVEKVVSQIPEEVRPAIILDFEKLPNTLFEEHKRELEKITESKVSNEEIDKAERKLIEVLKDSMLM